MNIKTNSKDVKEGDIFVAIKGNTVDGHDYIDEAINNGAKLIVCEKGKYSKPTLNVDSSLEYLKEYLVSNYSKEFNDLKFIGVTGTNGKTTTAYLISEMLTILGISNAYIGTLGYFVNNEFKEKTDNTTPDILNLYDLILKSKNNGVKVIVMEVSSHALEFERVKGIKFDVLAFTNLTEDHLDFHKTMDNYLKSKLKILGYLKEEGTIIVNDDDKYGMYFKQKNFKTISLERDSDYRVADYKQIGSQTKLIINNQGRTYLAFNNLLGKFNVYNYITSIAMLNSLGIDLRTLINVGSEVKAPSGRNEIINYGNNKIVIDYAHTPDAVLKIITAAREYTKGNIYTIIGCGGDRDRKKRPIMGNYATSASNYTIFTDDNPRNEDEEQIMNDILVGVKSDNYETIFSRKKAIQRGIDMLTDNDTLLILGKGHEDYEIFKGRKVHFSDREEVLNYLNRDNSLKLIQKDYK